MPTSEYIRLCKRTALIRPNVSFVLTNQPLTVVGFQKSEIILCSNVPKDLCSSGRGGIDLDRQQMTQLDKSGSPEILYFPYPTILSNTKIKIYLFHCVCLPLKIILEHCMQLFPKLSQAIFYSLRVYHLLMST